MVLVEPKDNRGNTVGKVGVHPKTDNQSISMAFKGSALKHCDDASFAGENPNPDKANAICR